MTTETAIAPILTTPVHVTSPVVTSPVVLTSPDHPKKNRIQVSNTKKPLFFYVNLAKRYIQQHDEVELSALGMAITTVVTVAEILKNNGLAVEKKVVTSTIGMKDETRGRLIQKARIEIVLGKTEKYATMATPPSAQAREKEAIANKEEKKQE
ncbi:DNA/RNA-binding protein Alba-like protein [Tanacetum coccineum]